MKKLDKKSIENILALTPLQEGMLFHYLKDPEDAQYAEQLCLNISGQLDSQCFERAWDVVTGTNEMLRTLFRWEKLEKPTQIILKEHHCDLHIYDLTDENDSQKKAALEEIKVLDRQKIFDPGRAPFRVTLGKIAGNKYQLIISNHHILYDGWSTGIILREFFDAYHALANGNQPVKPPAKPSFKEFIQWSQNQDKTKQERYWQEYLAGIDHPTALPIKKSRNEAGEIKGSVNTTMTMTLERSIKNRLEIFIKEHRLTLASFFYSTWGILLQRYCSTGDVIFGTTVSGRSAPIKGIQDMVGLFINTIPLRIKTYSGEKVKDLLGRVNDSVSIREKYESTPLVDIKEYSQLESNVELFDSLIVLENYPLDQRLMKKDSGLPLVVDSYSIVESTNYDLAVTITIGEMIGINFIYHPTSLEESSISRLSSHFNNIIEYILINPGSEIYQIEMLSAEEKKQVLYDFNETEAAYPQDKTIHELFAGQAEQTPDHTALLCPEGARGLAPVRLNARGENSLRAKSQELRTITYKELNEQSNRLAYLLQTKGVKPDTIVGIMLERSPEMIIGIFAILKAGAAYLPIDPDYPKERINYILEDSKVKFLINKGDNFNNFYPGSRIDAISIADISSDSFSSKAFNNSPKGASISPRQGDQPAYILYTSGSTGKPKGVIVEHTSVVNIVWTMQNLYPLGPSDTYLLKTAYVFDVSAAELFGWFLGGGRLAILEKGGEKDPGKILDIIERLAVTHINFVPSMFNSFVEGLNPGNIEKLSALKYIFLAGEVLLPGLVNKFKRFNTTIALGNIYGPTEGTVYTTFYSLTLWKGAGSVPIGKPLTNITVYILSINNQLQPIGVPGELCIGGTGLARGYLNRPELTAERFRRAVISHSSLVISSSKFSTNDQCPMTNDRLYCTGDLARWLPDGNIEFEGRMDYQVKIRGFRIELGEIENQLLNSPYVKETVVTAHENEVGDQYLCAYVVRGNASDPGSFTEMTEGLKKYLSRVLPDYMIPSFFVPLEKIPLTPNGKIDRKSLPGPEPGSLFEYAPPRDEVEKKLVEIWSEVFARDSIGIDDNFFNLGGHSLKATRLLARIHKVFNVRLSLEEIFKHPSIRRLSLSIKKALTHEYESIDPVEKKEYYFLSNAQQRLYILAQMEKENIHYNISAAFILEGVVHRGRLEDAFEQLIKRNESLRTSFMMKEEEPVQVIHDRVEFKIEYDEMKEVEGKVKDEGEGESFGHQSAKSQELRAKRCISSFIRPFDLSCAPLLRVGLIKLYTPTTLRGHPSQVGKEDRYLLMVDMHHIIGDGLSNRIIANQLAVYYDFKELPLLRIQYKDYTAWQKKEKEKGKILTQKAYWLKEFPGEIPVLNLPYDYLRPTIQRFEGNTISFEWEPQETKAVKQLAKKEDVTLYMIILAIYTVLLGKLSSQEDIVVGTPISGRKHTQLENIIGMFVNTLAMRNFPLDQKPFKQFLHEVKEKTWQGFENQDYPFEDLVEQVTITSGARDASRNPLFDVMLAFQDREFTDVHIPGIKMKPYPLDIGVSRFDLTLYAEDTGNTLRFGFEYCTKLFKKETLHRWVKYLNKIARLIARDPGLEIGKIEIISEEEKHTLLYDFNDTKTDYPTDKNLHELFTEQVERTPDHVAVIGVEGITGLAPLPTPISISLTYRELNEKSHRLAYLLREKGVEADTIVAIKIKRSPEMIIGLLAILTSGGAYLPIDPDYPAERVNLMLKDSNVGVLVTTPKPQDKVEIKKNTRQPGLSLQLIQIHTAPGFAFDPSLSTLTSTCQASPTNLAYIMYTSGSTGKPKGVMVEHGNVIRLVVNSNYVELTGETRILQTGAPVFDATTFEIWGALLNGGQLVLVEKEVVLDAHRLGQTIKQYKINTLWLTSPLFNQLAQENCKIFSNLDYLLVGGDVLTPRIINLVRSKNEKVKIINGYGPTENTTFSTTFLIEGNSEESIPIGSPIANSTAFILDPRGNLQPVGVLGELWVGGDGVSRGYLNSPELTAEKFKRAVNSQSSSVISNSSKLNDRSNKYLPNDRLYRTGDITRWLPGGNIEFLGRIDDQVKIRGFRIELAEIENQLLKLDKISETVVTARETRTGDKYLCAYIVFAKDQEFKVPELRGYLANTFPDYMVPSFFVPLEKIPLTPNGKVERKLLPEPEVELAVEYVTPGDEVEEKLVEIWSNVLGIEKESISIESNFFQLGGHSLKATIMISKIYKEFNVRITLAEIFQTPIIRKISQYIKSVNARKEIYASINKVEKKEYYTLSSAQKRLYVLQQIDDQGTGYNIPSVFIWEGEFDKHKSRETFKKLLKRHESMRTSFEEVKDEPVQRIHDEAEFEIEYHQSSFGGHLSLEGEEESSILNCQSRGEDSSPIEIGTIIREFIRPFELSLAPLLRVGLIELPHIQAALRGCPSQEGKERKYILMVDMHHIISDAFSMDIFTRDFMALYADEVLPGLKIYYKDYSQWQDRGKHEEKIKRQENFWIKEFEEEPPVLDLPADHTRPVVQSFAGKHLSFQLNHEKVTALKKIALEEDATIFMVLMTLFNILLAKISRQENIVVGTPVAARRHSDLEQVIGMFVNTLAMRNYPTGEKSFRGFLKEIKKRTLAALENQDYQFEDLVEKVVVNRDLSRNPLFDVMFVLQNVGIPGIDIPGLKLSPFAFESGISKFDLTFTVEELAEKLIFTVEFSAILFLPTTIQAFINYFKKIVSDVLNNKDIRIWEIEILSEKERRQLLYDFNDTAAWNPKNQTIHQLFENQVEQTPDHTALVGQMTSITYRKLNEKANQLARKLRKQGITPNTPVGIMMERSVEILPAILAILKAGAAYLPIDPHYPGKRINYIIADSGIKILLTSREQAEKENSINKKNDDLQLSMVNSQLKEPMKDSTEARHIPLASRHLHRQPAYILYTSGSTGKPKGVIVEHISVINVLSTMQKQYPLLESDAYLLKTSTTFDVSVAELFGWFFNGGRLTVLEKGQEKDPEMILNTIAHSSITHINFVPSMFNAFLSILNPGNIHKLSSLKYIFLAGEVLLPDLVKRFRKLNLNSDALLENIYGPTENTIYTSSYSLSAWEEKGTIPIGKPLANIRLYILDGYNHLQPIGIPGELCIGGTGLARGYLNRPELTVEKFCLRRPGALFEKTAPGPRKNFPLNMSHMSYMSYMAYMSYMSYIYQTGDLARWLPDGNVEFLGRIDHQVKVRGFRIELGEIENQILRYKEIKETVVVAREDENADKYLVAYIVPEPGNEIPLPGLREYLLKVLPDYMVPSIFMLLDKIPLTPSGKVDRRALPQPIITPGDRYVPPRSEIEKKLVEIWAGVLSLEGSKIGIHDNFFKLGGHSLKATTLALEIHKAFNIKLPLTEIFKRPTVERLTGYIREAAKEHHISIKVTEKKEYYTLSSIQKQLYALHQLDIDSTVYNMPLALLLEGEVDKDKLDDIFKKLTRRHASLRTSFVMAAVEPVQRVYDEVDLEIEYREMKGVKVEVEEEERTRGLAPLSILATRNSPPETTLISSFIRPFDLPRAPLLRVGLGGTGTQKHILLMDMHHIISDGISSGILVKEFMALAGDEKLPDLKLQYKDYSEWQKGEKQREALKKQENYWKRQFADEIPVLDLPTDFPRPALQSFEGSLVTFETGKETTAALKSLAQAEGTTLYMVLLAIYNIFLLKLSSQEDIIVGTPTAGRRHPDLEPIIGMFVNTLVLRNYPNSEKSFPAFLKEIKERTLEAFDYQDYQYEDLVDQVLAARDASRNPLFDTMFTVQNNAIPTIRIKDLKLTPLQYHGETSKFDLLLIGEEAGEDLHFTLEYSTRLFTANTVRRFIGFFNRIVNTVIENPTAKLAEIEIISAEEKQQLLFEFNDTTRQYPKDRPIHEIFAEQAAQTPGYTALVGVEGTGGLAPLPITISISYRELNNKSNQLAYLLKEKGVQPGTIVGLLLERSPAMIAGILSVLKAGGAYLPIDPANPQERVDFMLKDSNAQVLVVDDTSSASWLSFAPKALLNLSEGHHLNFPASQLPSFPASLHSSLAYIIYTSGSTGKPKGVMVEHRNVVRLVKNTNYVEFKENQRILQTGALEFDASTFEIWGALLNGLTLYLVDKGQILNPGRLKETINKYHISTIWMTSPLFNQMVQADEEIFAGLTHLLVGGDALSPSHIKRVKTRFPALKVINGYGPTENTTFSTTFLIEKEYTNIPIGSPIANSTAIILDKAHHLQPIKVAGELCVGGDGVSRGYLNDPELTAEKFTENYFYRSYKSNRTNIRLYKTGDLARWLPDGNIEFLGRIDHQVKLRGFRVEPGEIENRLLSRKGIKDAVVLVKQNQNQEKYLCAYLVPDKGYSPAGTTSLEEELRNYLQQTLPNYMVPAYFITMNRLPLTPNGKIDRKALPEPGAPAPGNRLTAPQNATQKKLVLMWAEILSIPSSRISIDSDFFEMGGHSLKALQVLNAVQKEFNVKIDFQDIFQYPTIAQLSNLIQKSKKTADEEILIQPEKDYYDLSYAQKRLWLLYQLEPHNPAFNLPTRLTLRHRVDETVVRKVLEKLVERHESFRTYFKTIKGGVVQVIRSQIPIDLETYDLTHLEARAREEKRIQLFKEESIEPFNLEIPPLFRMKLIKCNPDEFDVILTMHHIITDGWSMEVLEREFNLLYESSQTGLECNLPSLKYRCIDYVYWQEHLLADKGKMQGAREFWEKQLQGNHPILDLPYDFPKRNMESKESAAYGIVIPQEIMLNLKKIAAEHKGSLFMVLLAAFNLLLYRITGQEDLLLGVPGAARQHEDLKNIVGFFVNTLIFKNKINPDESFIHFLLRVQDNIIKVLEYQSFPLELLCSEFKIRYPEISVFFNMSIFGNTTQENLKSEDTYHLQTVQDAKFDIACYLGEYKNGITIETHYYKELFKPITIEKIIQLYRIILEDIGGNPQKQVGEYLYSFTRKKRKLTFSSPAQVLRE